MDPCRNPICEFGPYDTTKCPALERLAGDRNVGIRQGVRRLGSGKLRPLYGAVDFRAVRRGYCMTRSVLLAKRRFGNRRGQRGCHSRSGAKAVPRRKLCRNRPEPADGRLRRIATTSRRADQMAPSGRIGVAVQRCGLRSRLLPVRRDVLPRPNSWLSRSKASPEVRRTLFIQRMGSHRGERFCG